MTNTAELNEHGVTTSVLLITDVVVAVFSQNVLDTRHRMIHYLRIKRQTLFIFQFDG